jgi:hypothetical protein
MQRRWVLLLYNWIKLLHLYSYFRLSRWSDKNRSQDAAVGILHASYAVHEESKGRHIDQNHHITYRIPTFFQNLHKSIEEILTNKNVKEQTLEKDIILVLYDFFEHPIYLIYEMHVYHVSADFCPPKV